VLDNLFPDRANIVALSSIIFQDDGSPNTDNIYSPSRSDRVSILVGNEERMQILLSAEFHEFLEDMSRKDGFQVQSSDFFSMEKDMFDMREHAGRELLLVQLFKSQELC